MRTVSSNRAASGCYPGVFPSFMRHMATMDTLAALSWSRCDAPTDGLHASLNERRYDRVLVAGAATENIVRSRRWTDGNRRTPVKSLSTVQGRADQHEGQMAGAHWWVVVARGSWVALSRQLTLDARVGCERAA